MAKYTSWKGKNVVITGATGFVGSWLTKSLLEKGAHVTIIVRDVHPKGFLDSIKNEYQKLNGIVFGDLTCRSTVERTINDNDIDTCFHLAAQAIVNVALTSPISTFESNIIGTLNNLEACRTSKTIKKVVVASTDKVYGEPQSVPIKEDHPLLAKYPYDVSKASIDMITMSYHQTYGLPVGLTRCSNIYGGNDLNFSRIIPDTIRSVLLNKNPKIRSDGTPVRDYMHVSDVVNAYLRIADHMDRTDVVGKAFNFGTGKPSSVLNLVNKIIEISGKSHLKPVILGKEVKMINEQYLSSDRANSLLKWKANKSLEDGLRETIEWYSANESLWKHLI
jgi:CDP-glucose 4,6-dehydratase